MRNVWKGREHMTTKVESTVEKWEREFAEQFIGDIYKDTYKLIENFIRHSVQEARAEGYKEALNDMFDEIYKLAEPDERQPSSGDLHTNMDEMHNIRTKLLSSLKQEEGK